MTPEREAKMRLVYRVGRPAREDDPGYIDDGRALFAALDEARRAVEAQDDAVAAHEHEQTVTMAAIIRERDEARRERDAARDALARARSAVEAAEVAADAAREEAQALRARWQSSLVSLRTGTLERERDAALAREARLATAAAEVVRQVLGDDPSWWTPERRQDAANMVTTKVLGLHDALADAARTLTDADVEAIADALAQRYAHLAPGGLHAALRRGPQVDRGEKSLSRK